MNNVKRRASSVLKDESSAKQLKKDTIKGDIEQKSETEHQYSEGENKSDDDEDEEEEHSKFNAQTKANTTSQDIHIARETAELFKSNIFKLQIDELLEQVKLNNKNVLKVEKFLHKLYDMIQQVPESEEQSLVEVQSFFKNKIVAVPFVDPKPNAQNTNYKFKYMKPDVSLVGSFALKTGIHQPQGSSIDILLTMPTELFSKKDFLNFRCLHKRSVYLGWLTHHLSILFQKEKIDTFLKLEYEYFNNDTLLPILKIYCENPSNTAATDNDYNFYKTKFSINLIIGFPEKVFESKKLLPHKNCIRVAQDDPKADPSTLSATPLYNFSVLSSTTYELYLKYLYKTKKSTESFKEASILGRLWLQQRGFSSKISQSGSLGGFGTFEFTTLMAALLNGGGVNGNKILLHGFSSYQLFRGVIKFLATMDLCDFGHLQFHSDINYADAVSKYVEEGFHTPTLFDKTTKVNILTKMTVASYKALKEYAKMTLKMLNNVLQDQFANIFLINISKYDNIKYDLCYNLELPLGDDINKVLTSKFTPIEKIKFITIENFLVNKITSVLNYALGDRINALEVELVGQKSQFPIRKRKVYSSVGGHSLNFDYAKVKILVNPAESEKLVTRGPQHSEDITPEAATFKSFWGPKASLRRFKDGSIVHSCVWSTSATEPIISSIVDFVLKRHVTENIHIDNTVTKQFQELLPLPNLPASKTTSILNLTSYYNLKKSFDELYKLVFKMSLPLSVKSILPIGSAFRYTSLCQPVPFAYSNPDFLQDVIIEFETSQRWPDEITSLEKAKTAFLLKIQEQLDAEHGTKYKSYFTRDESIPYNLDVTTLNILTPEGYGFKFRVLTERDEVLYLRAISNARNDLKPLLEETFLKFTAKYLTSVKHTRTIENISHSYQLFSPVVRLFKKWLDSHLLLGHLTDELVEMIAIKPFVDAGAYHIPGSVENGFLKVLRFISQWNWKDEPVILDLIKPEDELENNFETSIGGSDIDAATMKKLSEKLTLAQYKGIQTNFGNLRKTDPNGLHLQFFVASKNDPSGILYSSNIPLAIATRLTALSKIAVNLIQSHGLNKQTIDLLFTPGLNDYDFVVKLKTPVGLKHSSGIIDNGEFRNISNDSAPTSFPEDIAQLSEKMDPTYQLVKYLNMKYKNSLIFSSHRYIGVNGGEKGDRNVITGLIKPHFKKQQKFKVNIDGNIKPVDKENVDLNKQALFHEIAAFSSDLVVDFLSK